ncbi:hypothetical protein NT98_5653 (plasmid) [Bacillus cereus]|nr:hypothetical protein NT98_5653 [Bacillus cereus]AJI08064.1 hypothetical protein AQ16_5514 [Bacillus cereus G9241]
MGSSFFVLGIYAFFINSYSGTVLWLSFVTGLAKKIYKILHNLSQVFSEMLAIPLTHQVKKIDYPKTIKMNFFAIKNNKIFRFGALQNVSLMVMSCPPVMERFWEKSFKF